MSAVFPVSKIWNKRHRDTSVYNSRPLNLLATLTSAFHLWVLLASGLALVEPGLFTWFSGPLIPIGLGIIMLSMGMTLSVDDFRRVGRERARVLPGVVLQYTVMPGLGWSLAALLDLPPPFAVGLILVSCCPGGTASNVISFLARADVALSVTMTAMSTLLAALMTPLLTEMLAGSRVDVPAGGLLLDTVQVVILPVVGGVLLQWRFPTVSQRLLPFAPLVAVVAITLIVASVIGAGRQDVIEAGPRLLMALLCLHVGGFVLGYLAGPAHASARNGGANRLDRSWDAELGSRRGTGAGELREPAAGHPVRDFNRDSLPSGERRGGDVAVHRQSPSSALTSEPATRSWRTP